MNGKLYDARTGRVLQGDIVKPANTRPTASLDGFVTAKAKPTKPVPDTKPLEQRPKTLRTKSAPINHKRRNPQRSQILMRAAVHKPSTQATKPAISSVSKVINSGERTMRAQSTLKSPYIHRYHPSATQGHVTKRAEHLRVAEPPQISAPSKTKNALTSHYPRVNHSPTPAVRSSEQLFNKALENAKPSPAHSPKSKKRSRSKAAGRTSIAGSVLAGFLLIGFIAYLNWPNLNIRLASSQAGFNAELPSYQPAGFRFAGPVDIEAGKVTISFRSNTDERAYNIKQEVSSWNSQSLEDNFLTAQNKTFDIQQEGGRTIYLYDQGKATWVNGGVWYQIDGQSLSPDQLVKIASSL